jgi:hypothetical protein
MRTIVRNAPFITIINDRTFYPGSTIVTDEEYAALKKNKFFNDQVACGNFTIGDEKKVEPPKDPDNTSSKYATVADQISKLKVREASEVIDGLLDIDALNKIKETDSRTGIQRLVADRIEMLLSRDDDEKED